MFEAKNRVVGHFNTLVLKNSNPTRITTGTFKNMQGWLNQ